MHSLRGTHRAKVGGRIPEVGYFRICEEGDFSTRDVLKMDRDRSMMTKRILDLTMEIIYLLTGEKYAAVKMTFIEGLLQGIYPPVLEGCSSSRSPILQHAPHSLEPERNNDEKIIEVAQNIIDLLTGEVPIRCQDVTVYFSMEEWEYIEEHKDLYKDIILEDWPPLTSPDGSSNRESQDSMQEDHTIPQHYQGEDLNDGTVPYVEETSSMADDRCLQEDIPPEISRDGHHTRRSSEERPTCSLNKDDVVKDSQGENLVTPNIHPRPHGADTSTDPSYSKNSFTKETHSVMPIVHFGLRNVDRSLNPSNSEEPSPMELDTVSSNIHSALSRSPDLSSPNEPPDKMHTAPDINPELRGSLHPTNPKESSLDVSCTLSPNTHLRQQNTEESLDLTNPEDSIQDKTHIVTSTINLGLLNTDRPPESKESSRFKSHTSTSNIHLELNRSPDPSHPERSSAQSKTDVNINSGLDSSDRSVDASKPKEFSSINAYILTPKIHSACESSFDGSPAFSLSTPPGVPSVDRSADPSKLRESFADKSHSVTLHMYPEPCNVHRSPLPLNPEACHPIQSQTATADMYSECHRSLDPSCVGESSTTSNTIHDVYSGPHNVDRSLDPDKSSATSHTIPNGNSGPHNTDRSLDTDESSATSLTISYVNPGPHSMDRSQDPCYPQESSATSPTIPNVNSGVHIANNPSDPVHSWVSFLMKLHTSGSNMHSSLTPSLNPSDPDDSCDKQLPVQNMNPEFHTSSRSPYFTNLGEFYPDKSSAGTLNLQPDHCSVDRIPDLTYPGKPQTVTLDVHQEIPSVDRTPHSPESSLTKSHVIIQSKSNNSLDPSYSVESPTSSQTPANIHSGFHKANRSTDYLDLGVSSPLKSHTVSSNTQAMINRSLDPSYPVEPSEILHTVLNINAGLHSTSRLLHSSNPNESSPDISHTVTQNIHSVQHYADIALDRTNPEESSEKPHPDTSDIHHSVSRTLDPEVSCPMTSHNITSNTYSEFNSPDPSDKSSLGSHTAPNIHSGLQTTDSSKDPPIDYLLSNKLLITLNVHPELYLMDKSSIPSSPEEYSSIKSLIISPNIRSLRGRSPDPSSGEPSDELHTAPNISLRLQSPDRSLHSYSEESSVDITHAVIPNIHSGHHSVDTILEPEVSDHMKSHTVTPNLHSLNRSPDSCYPDESTDKSHSSLNNYAGHRSQNKSPEPYIAELSPPNVSLNVDLNVLPEHDIAKRSPNHSRPTDFCSMKSSIVSPTICSFNRSPDSYHPDESSAKSHASPNIYAGHHSENRSPDASIAEQSSQSLSLSVDLNVYPEHHNGNKSPEPSISEQSPPNISLSVDSNVHPERPSVNRSPNHSHPTELFSMKSHSVSPNICSLNRSLDSYYPDESSAKSNVSPNIHVGHHSENRSPDPSVTLQSPPSVSMSVDPNVYPEHHNVNRSPDPSIAQKSSPNVSLNVDSNVLPEHQSVDRTPSRFHPKDFIPMESHTFMPNVGSEFQSADRSPDPSKLDEYSIDASNIHPEVSFHAMSQSVTQDAHLEHHNVDSPPSHFNPKEPGSMELPPITTNILQEMCNAHPCLDSSGLHTMSQSVTQDASLERHNVDSPPSPSNPKEPGSMELPPITTTCLDSSGLHTMSQSITQDSPLERHSVDSPPSPSNPKEPGSMELPPITTNILQELCNAHPCMESSGLHTMSQSVTQDAPLECHNVDSSLSPSNPKESRSSDSPPITTDILQELCNAHRCLDSSGLHESFQALAQNIYYEPLSAHNLADSCGPEELAPNDSLAITPTNNPEICSLDNTPKSSEEYSLEKSYYVLPNIHLEPHKADQSPDTSNIQETSFEQTYTVTPNNGLAPHQTLEASNSEEHSQNKSRAPTINPSNPKQSLPDQSGCATGNTDQNGLREISCPVCGRCFRRQTIFLKHWGSYCGKIFKEKPRPKKPSKKKSGKKSSPPAKQGGLFKKKGVVLKEPNTQQSKGPYPCPECGKFYSQKSNLLQHRRIHTGLKPFSCLHCGKCFTKKISLVTHIRIHSGEKPFKCKQCGKCFGQQGHLDRHRKMHTGEKPYPCTECDKSFLQKCDLVKHRRIHTGQRPYACSECGKSFTETSGLKRHRRRHQ
ncbi:uncharacterized protein LOC143956160 isoform X1 [Lithobates pipiens]